MQHARDRIGALTAREQPVLPVETVVQDVNRFPRGRAGYLRSGHSARPFDRIMTDALGRLALFVAKRHKRPRGYGWWAVAYQSSDRLGLINRNGTVVAPRPNWGPRGKPNAGGAGGR